MGMARKDITMASIPECGQRWREDPRVKSGTGKALHLGNVLQECEAHIALPCSQHLVLCCLFLQIIQRAGVGATGVSFATV